MLFCKPDFDIKDGFFVEGHLTKIKEYLSAQTSQSQSTGIEIRDETEVMEDTIDEFEELDDKNAVENENIKKELSDQDEQ